MKSAIKWAVGFAALAFVLVFSACATPGAHNRDLEDPWALVRAAAPLKQGEKAEAIGSYSSGCLLGAVTLAPDGPGYQVMRLTRGRFYGHPNLIQFIREFGRKLNRQSRGSVLLVGDMSQPRGGPALTGHRSHQIGLDVDLWYSTPSDSGTRSLLLGEREQLSAESLVAADGKTLKPGLWGAAQVRLLKLASGFEEVDRIFVNAAIKKELCRSVPVKQRAWLGKLRPWWGHDDHFHVRLKCAGTQCKGQEEVPAGDGCDATLDWWFTDEAKLKGSSETSPVSKPPGLPAACQEVLERPS